MKGLRLCSSDEPETIKANDKPKKLTVESSDNHVYFYATVDSDRCLALIKEIRSLDKQLRGERLTRSLPDDFPMTPIWLHVNSGGGYLFDGLSVADQLQTIATPVYSVVEGYAASSATFISMACTRRFIQPSAFVLIHQFSSFFWGKYEDFKDEMRLLDMAMGRLVSFYTARSKMDEGTVRDLLKRESWFNAQQALEMGLVDEVWS